MVVQTRSGSMDKDKQPLSEIPLDHIKLYFIDIMNDPAVISKLKTALSNTDEMADRVAARLDVRFKSLQADLKRKDDEIQQLREEIESLKNKADDNEQYSRRTTVRITGIPEAPGESAEFPEREVQKMITAVGGNAVIQRCHRVGPKNKGSTASASASSAANAPAATPRAVICQFTGQRDKRHVMDLKKSIHEKFHVRINEDLTRYRATLAFHARKLKREGKIKNTWTSDGKILVQDLSMKIHLVRKTNDLVQW